MVQGTTASKDQPKEQVSGPASRGTSLPQQSPCPALVVYFGTQGPQLSPWLSGRPSVQQGHVAGGVGREYLSTLW